MLCNKCRMISQKRHIYFLCLVEGKPIGGLRKIYEHVEILNRMGLQAYVLHNKKGFRYDWFESTAPIAYIESLFDPLLIFNDSGDVVEELPPISRDDILVVPETFAYQILPNASKFQFYSVIFNQNAYFTFINASLPSHPFGSEEAMMESPYHSQYLLETLVVSDENVDYLKYTFPEVSISRIRLGIDFNLFPFQENKKKQIAFMPRKCKEDSLEVVNLIKSRNLLKDWTLVPIVNKREEEVGQILKDCAIFMSFSFQEGFGLPPIEALACGCLLIGYHGSAGVEYFLPSFSTVIPKGNILEYVERVEKLAIQYENDREENLKRMHCGLEFVRDHYSKAKENEDINRIWTEIIKKHELKLQESHE